MDLSSEDSDDNAESFESDSSSISQCIVNEWRLIAIGVENADPVCVKLNELIRRGKISKDKIFYKYLHDVIEFYCDPRHEYSEDVVEFFNTLTYLGGRRTTNMIRGPMFAGQGRGSFHSLESCKMNLGGPSEETCRKRQAGYTTKSGVIKSLSSTFLRLSCTDGVSKTATLIDTDSLKVVPCALANDGTALKPSIQFDPRTKRNVGLTIDADAQFVQENPNPSPEFLSEHIITEALVSSITALDNSCSLPCAVEYVGKKGKTGEEMKKRFDTTCKLLQICEECRDIAPSNENILSSEAIDICDSTCEACIEGKAVCGKCEQNGQTSFFPSLRACKRCIESRKRCVKAAILILTVDCEEGNKKAMSEILKELENGTRDPSLSLVIPIPDCVHVGKSLKAGFANWYLKLENERGNLAILKTLRNKASPEVRKTMRKFLPRNDHVRNKDRQDPAAVIRLTDEKLTEYLQKLEFVSHTIIPEMDHFTEHNRVGMYPHPISTAVGPFGNLLFLTLNQETDKSNLYMAQLHNPVQKVELLKKSVAAKEVHFNSDIVFLSGNLGLIAFHELVKGSVCVDVTKLRNRNEVLEKVNELGLSNGGTVSEMKDRIENHVAKIKREYERKGFKSDHINFWNDDDLNGCQFEAIHVVDRHFVYGACVKKKSILAIIMEGDGYGIRGTVSLLINYEADWQHVGSMAVLERCLYTSHCKGIDEICLSSLNKVRVILQGVSYSSLSPSVVSYKTGILYADPKSHRILLWRKNLDKVEVFAGSGSAGNMDGVASKTEFYQPVSLCVEFDHIVYVCDAQTNCIKILTSLKKTAEFLNAMGKIYNAFSVHEKHQTYKLSSIQDAVGLVSDTLQILRRNESCIREEVDNLPKTLNGPQGNVASKTVTSVEMLKCGLEKLQQVSETHGYDALNLLSCMTLDVENIHSIVHHKDPLCTVLDYARNFGNAAKEGLKRSTHWSAHYFTNRKSWYPVPERAMNLSAIPVLPPLPAIPMAPQGIQAMRDWAQTFGAAVRQRSVRQETTMARAGTLPSYLYQKEIQPGEWVCLDQSTSQDQQRNGEQEDDSEDGILEYDSPSSREESGDESFSNNDNEADDDTGAIPSLEREADFLLGRVSRFGRSIRFNSRIFF